MSKPSPIEDILIADDDSDDLLFFTLALGELSIKIRLQHATNGEILLKMLKRHIPDILFLDILMPCKDGVTCIREIRQDKRYDQMHVVMLSSAHSAEYIERTYRLGANFFIRKTDSVAELAAKIKEVFIRHQQHHMIYPALPDFVL